MLFDRFSNHCLANAVEPLRAANELARRPLYRWQFLSVDGAPVQSSSGMPVVPDTRLRDHPGGAALFVLPSYEVRRHATDATARALRSAAPRFQSLVAMDTGSWLLAHAGLLDGRRATIHWDELARFSEAFDRVETQRARWVDDGDILSCGGAMTAFELVLAMIGQRHGEALRLEVASLFMSLAEDRTGLPTAPATGSALTDAAVGVMLSHIEAPLPIATLAAQIGTTQRKLGHELRRCLGVGPQSVYRQLRLNAARRLAEQTTMSVAEIAVRTGYQNPAALTRACVEVFGATPTALRRAAHMPSASL